jgi:hypothetical protein
MKQLGVSHEMPHTIPEDYTILISSAQVLSVWFLHVSLSQTQNLSWKDTANCTHSNKIGWLFA